MNYKNIYDKIIQKAINENRKKIKNGKRYEKHHIIPKTLGGNNLKDNLVLLTPREHYICHKLLAEIYPRNRGIICGFAMMVNIKRHGRNYKISSREYERLKIIFIESQIGDKNPMYDKKGVLSSRYNTQHTEETKKKISKSNKGRFSGEKNFMFGKRGKLSPNFGIKHNEEFCLKISKRFLNVPKSEEHKQKLRKPKSEECKDKISKSKLGVPRSKEAVEHLKTIMRGSGNPMYGKKQKILTCIYCGKSGGSGAFNRWHFENCKYKN